MKQLLKFVALVMVGRSASLGPNMWHVWAELGLGQALTGDSAEAAQSLKGFVRDADEMIAPLSADDARRQLLANRNQQMRALLELAEGQSQAALNDDTAVIDHLDTVKLPPGSNAENLKRRFLNGMLLTASHAGLRLGRYAQAETLSRRWLALPPDEK